MSRLWCGERGTEGHCNRDVVMPDWLRLIRSVQWFSLGWLTAGRAGNLPIAVGRSAPSCPRSLLAGRTHRSPGGEDSSRPRRACELIAQNLALAKTNECKPLRANCLLPSSLTHSLLGGYF